jgi:DMSO/TMAO reductase YedYZ molybdopterin-dependent catalytic subunit
MAPADDRPADDTPPGAPVGRRVVLGLAGLGVAGVLGGATFSQRLSEWLAPAQLRDPSGLLALLPLGPVFRYYSVTGPVEPRDAASYRLEVGGLVDRPTTYTMADLRAMPQTSFTSDFHCVTGWVVPEVPWVGVRLGDLIDLARPTTAAGAVRFRSFDGVYTESLTLEDAHRDDVIVALRMLGGPVSHDHGGPVRTHAASMYGYKGTKWLSAIELTAEEQPGYWEERGYDIDGTIRD